MESLLYKGHRFLLIRRVDFPDRPMQRLLGYHRILNLPGAILWEYKTEGWQASCDFHLRGKHQGATSPIYSEISNALDWLLDEISPHAIAAIVEPKEVTQDAE